LTSCCGIPIKRNLVLEELRVKKISSHARIYLRMLKLSDARVENGWIEREEKLCVVGIKVTVQGE